MGVVLALSGTADSYGKRLCTNDGYSQLSAWIEALPGDEYPALKAFVRDSKFRPTEDLAAQLNAAANAHRPPEDGTAEMVELLLDSIGLGRPDETATVEVGG